MIRVLKLRVCPQWLAEIGLLLLTARFIVARFGGRIGSRSGLSWVLWVSCIGSLRN